VIAPAARKAVMAPRDRCKILRQFIGKNRILVVTMPTAWMP